MSANFNDGLQSLVSALGDPLRDKNASTFYGVPYLSDFQLTNAYRGSWLARKIVDIPADDSVRAGVNWMAEQDQIEAIEGEQDRLRVLQKIKRARILGRLLGGGALYIGTDQVPSTPLNAERVGKGGLKYLVVHSRLSLTAGEIDRDPMSETYQQPKFYTTHGDNQTQIHPSRLVIFKGAETPQDMPIIPGFNAATWGWSDSVLQPIYSALRNADVAPDLIVSLLHEANVDRIGIEDFLASLINPEYEAKLMKRMSISAASKGINGMMLLDKSDEYSRESASFAGLPDVMDRLLTIVSGAADIPATRLLGQSPAGMSATGESDMRNYYDRLSADQRLEMSPACYNLFDCLLRSTLGSRPDDVWYQWAPLWQLSAVELSTIGKQNADTAAVLNNTGLIAPEALSKVVINQMVETGYYPGLEDAAAETPVDFEEEARKAEEERQAALNPPAPAAFGDATKPRTLYMRRMVKNGAAIVSWARAQGFTQPMDAASMHVTIVYSRQPIDWMLVGEAWQAELKIAAGGPRVIERFGDGGAIVLAFASSELKWRNQAALEAGASSDYDEYQPHITVSWLDPRLDVSTVEPYAGEIVLGPELFSEIDA